MAETKNTKVLYNTEIPSDWDVKELKDIGKWFGGGTPSKEIKNYWSDGTIPWASSQDIKENNLNETTYKITEEALHNSASKLVPSDSLLMVTRSGILQHTFPVAKTLFPVAINQDIKALILKEGFDVNFVQNYLLFKNKDILDACGKVGTTVESIEYTWLQAYIIPIPPLPEQRAIAQVLGTADAAIHSTEKLIAQKELRKKWLMQQLLTGKKRLKGFDGEWKEYSFDKLLKVVKRPVKWDDNELYKLISVKRRSGGIFFREALYGHQIKVKDLRDTEAGDFLFSKMQIVHGASALVTKEFEGAKISGSYIAAVAKDPKILNMEFFNWYSQLPYFYHQALISSYGVHIEKMTFDFDTFLQLEMKLPSIEEQTAIAQVLQAADKEISLLKAKVEKLREQKKGLMQVLLTGKVRLKI
jgi:type I restriction enzyme S subunit